jgi:hypothetical protein
MTLCPYCRDRRVLEVRTDIDNRFVECQACSTPAARALWREIARMRREIAESKKRSNQ